MTVRSPSFAWPTQIDPLAIAEQPEMFYLLVGVSLSLPYLEPFLIRTVSEAKQHLDDPALLEQIRLLNAQEGQHVRLHTRFNKAAVGQKFPALVALEKELAEDCRRFTATRSLQWRLAYVESLEAFTVAFSLFLLEGQPLRDMQPAVRDLFEWHAAEELEHRSVVFDVYNHLYDDNAFRAIVRPYAQWHFTRFVIRAIRLMLAHDRELGRDYGRPAQVRRRVLSLLGQFARGMLPKVLASHSPRYLPHTIPVPPSATAVLERIAARDTRAAATAAATAAASSSAAAASAASAAAAAS